MPRAAIVAFAALAATSAFAYPDFQQVIPNGRAAKDSKSGITCEALGHEGCVQGAARNAFGLAFKKSGTKWTKELCMADSDGDGLTNG
jgi:hypothetical protein